MYICMYMDFFAQWWFYQPFIYAKLLLLLYIVNLFISNAYVYMFGFLPDLKSVIYFSFQPSETKPNKCWLQWKGALKKGLNSTGMQNTCVADTATCYKYNAQRISDTVGHRHGITYVSKNNAVAEYEQIHLCWTASMHISCRNPI